MERNIAVYNADGALIEWIDRKRLVRLQNHGRVARVTSTRTGKPVRVRLLRMPGEPRPTLLRDLLGTKYCFRQRLADGHYCFKLRALGERDKHGEDEYNLAPEEVRPIFLAVVRGCMAPAM
jgi:hypothetical protein